MGIEMQVMEVLLHPIVQTPTQLNQGHIIHLAIQIPKTKESSIEGSLLIPTRQPQQTKPNRVPTMDHNHQATKKITIYKQLLWPVLGAMTKIQLSFTDKFKNKRNFKKDLGNDIEFTF